MTALETLQKYNLKTDVQSIKERLDKNAYWDVAFEEAWRDNEHTVDDMEIIIRSADIALLCELAKKGETMNEALKALERIKEKGYLTGAKDLVDDGDLTVIELAISRLESAEKELAEIKERAETKRKALDELAKKYDKIPNLDGQHRAKKEKNRVVNSLIKRVVLIDFIIKGEGK